MTSLIEANFRRHKDLLLLSKRNHLTETFKGFDLNDAKKDTTPVDLKVLKNALKSKLKDKKAYQCISGMFLFIQSKETRLLFLSKWVSSNSTKS